MKSKLGDMLNIRTGKLDANASSPNGKYPFFTCSKEPLKIDTYSYDCECVLVAGNGDLNVKYYNGKFDAYQRTYILEKKNDNLYMPYLYYFMEKYIDTLRSQSIGGVIKYIKLENITDAKIELLPKDEQVRICKILDKVKSSINSQKHQLQKLDTLIKARFVEMFGDGINNNKNYDTTKFGNFVHQMNIGPFGSDLKNDSFVEEEDGYCVVYEQKHAIEKSLNVKTRYIDKSKYEQLKRFTVGPGDIIVSCRGTIGECYVLPNDAQKGVIHPSLMMIRPKEEYDHLFLVFILNKILSEQQNNGSSIKMAIKASQLANIECINPPKEKQTTFATFVHHIDKLKFA